ncbi:MAG: carbamoyltransferase [Candidatus Pelagibacterales bacterium]
MTSILGISAFYHDSAATILINGKILAAAQEERFTRKKHDSSFPFKAIEFVLNYSNLKLSEIDYIVFYEKPFLKFERLLETYVAFAPRGFQQFIKSMPKWLREKLFQKKMIIDSLKIFDENFNGKNNLYFSEHHLSHASSAFFPSSFEEAIILTADGVGEWATTTVAIGKGNDLQIKKEIHFPHSLGLLYSSFTYFAGFKVNSGEYKLMGLAPYGVPKYSNIIKDKIVDIKEDGSFRLNHEFFNYSTGFTMTSKKFNHLFGRKPRDAKKEKIAQFHMDLAASIQDVTEDIMVKLARSLKKEYKINNLCLAGGVALNCVANGKIIKNKIFENVWIQPAAGDSGGSLGAALAMWYNELKSDRKINTIDQMQGSYLGPEYTNHEIEKELKKVGAKYVYMNDDELIKKTAESLDRGEAIAWFQGRMEFGPRALGSRSILGDPRSTTMQKDLNLKIKFRESFRPFAPSILRDDLKEWFEIDEDSPYMLVVADVLEEKRITVNEKEQELSGLKKLRVKRSIIPAVTHVDYSARIQTVNKDNNPKYYLLLKEFKKITDCPMLINTSFNVRGEPIVNTPSEAFNCFMGTKLDKLVIGNYYLDKNIQNQSLLTNYKEKFDLD